MSIFSDIRRIADALERAYPPTPVTEDVELKPEEAVSYVDEEKMAQQELKEQSSAIEQWLAEHPIEEEDVQPEDSRASHSEV